MTPSRGEQPSKHELIFAAVRRIPRGRVSTYGDVARLAGLPNQPRLVGYALAALPAASVVPWHRVINAKGEISLRRSGVDSTVEQRLRLEREGVRFDERGRVSLDRFAWRPRAETLQSSRTRAVE
jgi:methylated-DNA-protein-cysteine methyltransferase related protein